MAVRHLGGHTPDFGAILKAGLPRQQNRHLAEAQWFLHTQTTVADGSCTEMTGFTVRAPVPLGMVTKLIQRTGMLIVQNTTSGHSVCMCEYMTFSHLTRICHTRHKKHGHYDYANTTQRVVRHWKHSHGAHRACYQGPSAAAAAAVLSVEEHVSIIWVRNREVLLYKLCTGN